MAIYNGGLNIKQYSAGTGIEIDSSNIINNCNRWNAITQGCTWSRICFLTPSINTEGLSGILSVSCTRANVVSNATFTINTSHSNTCNIIQIGANNYTSFKIRGIVNSGGETYIEIYDSSNNIASGTTQTWHCSWLPLLSSTITKYTSFTSGASIPSGYVEDTVLTVYTGNNIVADNFIGNLTGNADQITTILNTSTNSSLPVLFALTPPDHAGDHQNIHINPNIYVIPKAGSLTANAVYGAYWNDLADSIPLGEGDIVEPGYCYCFDGEHYTKTSKYMQQSYIGIHSDTYGFRMGFEKEKEKLDVAVSGFALAYVDKEYPVGTPLTCTKNGYLTEISKEDKRNNPEMVIAKYWKSEPNEEWGIDNRKVKVNGRKWVKIK